MALGGYAMGAGTTDHRAPAYHERGGGAGTAHRSGGRRATDRRWRSGLRRPDALDAYGARAGACWRRGRPYRGPGLPKRAHYHREYREHLIPADEMATKIAYAVKARRDPNFVVIARTDAMQTDGYAEGVRRANLFAEAGADMVMIFPKTLDEAANAPRDCKATNLRQQHRQPHWPADPNHPAALRVRLRRLHGCDQRGHRPVHGSARGHAALPPVRPRRDRRRGGAGGAARHRAPDRLETYYRIEEETVERARA